LKLKPIIEIVKLPEVGLGKSKEVLSFNAASRAVPTFTVNNWLTGEAGSKVSSPGCAAVGR
jgi:hypothetical protein